MVRPVLEIKLEYTYTMICTAETCVLCYFTQPRPQRAGGVAFSICIVLGSFHPYLSPCLHRKPGPLSSFSATLCKSCWTCLCPEMWPVSTSGSDGPGSLLSCSCWTWVVWQYLKKALISNKSQLFFLGQPVDKLIGEGNDSALEQMLHVFNLCYLQVGLGKGPTWNPRAAANSVWDS